MRTKLLLTLLPAGLFACQAPSTPPPVEVWPGAVWQQSTPAAQAMNPEPLTELHREFQAGGHGYIDEMLVIRNGSVVFDQSYQRDYDTPYQDKDHFEGPYNYFNPEYHPYYRRSRLHTLQSVTKSVTSAVFGVAAARGEGPALDAEIIQFFDDYTIAHLDDRKRRIQLRHLLTMTAGIDWDETIPYSDPANPAVAMEATDNWVQFVLDRPMAHEPGEVFSYSSGVSQLLSVIFAKATGRAIDEYAQEHLFGPLGIREYHWKRTPLGLVDTEGGLYLSAHDLARIGYLYLKDGIWAGQRLLAEGWVRESTTPHVAVARSNFAYGYQWWLRPYDASDPGKFAYTGLGYGGQRLFVVPEYDLVAVFMGWNLYEHPVLDPVFALNRVLEAMR